ncbi:MAG: DUF2508 family protein [Oscillospiraceae bacterium]
MEGIVNLISRLPMLKAKEKIVIDTKKIDLIQHIKETNTRLRAMRSAFECETNFDLIEVYILEIDSLERKYSYLIRQAKTQHIAAF